MQMVIGKDKSENFKRKGRESFVGILLQQNDGFYFCISIYWAKDDIPQTFSNFHI